MTVDKELKKKISARWKILTDVQSKPREYQDAFAELTYIMTEAGLLAKQRKKRKKHEFGKIERNDHVLAPDEERDAYASESTSFPRNDE